MRARLSVMLVASLVMVITSLQVPAAFAQGRDPNEGEPKHEINELQNRLHQTDDKSKENRLEDKIDALQDQRIEGLQAGGGNGGRGWYQLPGLKPFFCPGGSQACKDERYRIRDACIAGAAFSFGLALLHPDCKATIEGL